MQEMFIIIIIPGALHECYRIF